MEREGRISPKDILIIATLLDVRFRGHIAENIAKFLIDTTPRVVKLSEMNNIQFDLANARVIRRHIPMHLNSGLFTLARTVELLSQEPINPIDIPTPDLYPTTPELHPTTSSSSNTYNN